MYFDQLAGQTASIDNVLASRDRDMVLNIREMNKKSRIGWTTSSHTGIPVPVYAMGTNSHLFSGRMDNTDIPKRSARRWALRFNA